MPCDLECTEEIGANKSTLRYKAIFGIKYSNIIWWEQKQFTEFSRLLLADMKISVQDMGKNIFLTTLITQPRDTEEKDAQCHAAQLL